MKHFYILILLVSSISFAQIPAGYYDSATGSDYTLKTQLKVIITNGHTFNSNSYDNLYVAYQNSDSDNYYENDGSVLDMYSERPTASDQYNYAHGNMQCGNYSGEGDCYNREHIFPQGFFDNSDNLPMVSDIHHVVPSDGRVNGFRSNFPFGVVDDSNLASQSGISNPTSNGSKLGASLTPGYSGTVFEPIDEFKGDIARMLLYFAVRYEDNWNDAGWDPHTATNNPLNGTSDQFYEDWYIDLLLDWHANDAVNQREIDRNNAAYNLQGNRNPFIDHPEYVNMIWNSAADTESPSDPTNLVASNPTDNTIDLTWTASTDNIAVVSYDVYIDANFGFNTSNANATVTGLLANTNYCFTVKAKDAANNTSNFSNQDCEITTNNGSSSGGIDLFFSEYVEGSGTNKALEIANYTGNSVNLSIYTIKIAFNSNPFTTTYSFPSGSITNGDVFVVANSGLLAACQSQQDDVNNSITGFNGNDAIGLFKNNVLIDIIGIEADGNDFAKDITLRRIPTVDSPTTTYNSAEWTTETTNDCSGLGNHTQTLGIESPNITEQIKFYPNPVKSKLNIQLHTNIDTQIEIYDILGKRVFVRNINKSTELNMRTFKSGLYLVKFIQNDKVTTKKLIVE